MKLFVLFKKYIVASMLLISSTVFAENKGFYIAVKKGTGLYPSTSNQPFTHFVQQTDNTSEWDVFREQIAQLADKAKGKKISEARSAAFDVFNFKPSYGTFDLGLGYYFQLMMPFAFELKGLLECHDKVWSPFFLSSTFKLFLPLGSKTKLYAKIGKHFPLGHIDPSDSAPSMHEQVFTQLRETVWNRSLKAQWRDSSTLLGAGIISKISSRLELDLSGEGTTTRNCDTFYFTISVGGNYLLSV